MDHPESPTRPNAPFVLLDAGDDGRALRLYRDPAEIVIARHPGEVPAALARLEALHQTGAWLAGTIAYEAGLVLEPRLAARAAARHGADGPLLWFGAFAAPVVIPGAQADAWLAETAGEGAIGPLEPQLSPGGYAARFGHIAEAIAAGDIYQANLTMPLAGAWRGDPLAIYAALRARGQGRHGGVVCTGAHWLLSLSPELFFALEGGAVTVKPMKGTRPRGATAEADAAAAADLVASVKDRAENLMILDLMRNDLARVADPGSVRVADPFAIESYASVHQMVSTVTARLADGVGPVGLLAALFPCGSVTGAPKIRAMELIDATEIAPRGTYCGGMGAIDPVDSKGAGGARFNVAIRTLRLTQGDGGNGGRATLGVGSAVVADSVAIDEWRECLVKGGFVTQPQARERQSAPVAAFDLIETMAFTPDGGIPLLERHLARLSTSAQALGFAFDRHATRNAIQALCFEAEAPSKLRLMLGRSGATALEISPMPQVFSGPVDCVVLPLPVDAGDWRLAHKTTDRGFYEAGLRMAARHGAGEALFIRDDGLITEGCFTSVFVARDGVLLTPAGRLGLLPGVLRAELLAEGRAVEADLTLDDLSAGFLIGNALRGLMPARLLA